MSATEYIELFSHIAPIISACTAVIAAIFVSHQIANIRRNREIDTLFKVITLSDSERVRAAKDWFIYELDDHLTLQQLKADKDAFKKFSDIVHLFETMGVIVNNKYISEKLIFDKYGLFIIGAWGRLQRLITALRAEWQSDEYGENFELLVSKYNRWAKSTPLKTAKGERIRLRDGRSLFDYGKGERTPGGQIVTGSNQK